MCLAQHGTRSGELLAHLTCHSSQCASYGRCCMLICACCFVGCRGCVYSWNALLCLGPTTHTTDSSRFLACYKGVVKSATAALEAYLPVHMPAVQHLRPSDLYDIVQLALQSPMRAVPHSVLTMEMRTTHQRSSSSSCPAAIVWSTEVLGYMMYLAACARDWEPHVALCHCPAAKQLSAIKVAHILLVLL